MHTCAPVTLCDFAICTTWVRLYTGAPPCVEKLQTQIERRHNVKASD